MTGIGVTKRLDRSALWAVLLAVASAPAISLGAEGGAVVVRPFETGPIGGYDTKTPAGVPLRVEYCVPADSTPDSPILIVIPGARRNTAEYRDEWIDLAVANGFVVVTPGATHEHFPTEYDYNAGGVVDATGRLRPQHEWLFSAIEPLFDGFRLRFGLRSRSYSIYGHSAGGGFVHRFLLKVPNARVDRAVAANPAFCTYPVPDNAYPFGVGGAAVSDGDLRAWFSRPLVVLLGDRDTGPRKHPLSNGPEALEQGPNVFARGLGFFRSALVESDRLGAPFAWRLEVVNGVGHSNTHMASHAVRHLFPE
ncbi:alpha/beta hydrolase [Botrimarina hoheduenensis]|uniref:Alpha/beta hydrolase family protein n=1 Tax=Botrimarina hoheduenensis TaxID=2528000 RepID=A0A5C5VUK5_9BACT|nr:alpha/beta hydrolase [Botrimarina hoheduenensis]TWT41329.1 Alpha/beta hydrolase family protein [Botrimarina hoheduenensis]